MECTQCGRQNRPERRFCAGCGGALPLVCPNCGFGNQPDERFCGGCGKALAAGEPTPGPDDPAEPAPARPASPGTRAGERRRATVLFSDLSGFTAMGERLDPEEVKALMGRVMGEAERIVAAHGGTVNQFVGDEVFALFGIPTAHEDDAPRAVRAALELHAAVRKLGAEVEGRIGQPLRMHTGINTGLVVASPGEGDRRGGRYEVTGDTVNTAARLAALAQADQVVVGGDTHRLVAPYFETEALEPVVLKGKARPLAPYLVLGETAVATRFEAAERRGLTEFAGREAELAALQGCLAKTLAGQGQFVTVVGEAGVGKSRLLFEFRHSLDREKVTVLEGRCQSYGTATPYLPLLDALRRGLRLEEGDTAEQLREKTVANVLVVDPALETYLPHYLHLLSIPNEDYPLPKGLNGEALREALVEALAAINIQNAHNKPMVVLLEDWHWADEASDAALKRMVGMFAAHPLLLVVNHRPEYAADWGAQAHHKPIVLAPLAADGAETIARSVLGADALPEGLAALLHERTGGNPYFVEELCRSLLEEGALAVEGGAAELTRPLEKLAVPGTVEAVIQTRLDRLDEDHRETLRLASVIGREFARRLLERIATEQSALSPVLESLAGQELIRQVRLLPEAAYIFKHALMQGVVYEAILLQQRKTLHALVARAIEELYPDRLEEHYEALAHHYSQSDDTEKALHYQELAGDKAADLASVAEAIGRYRKILNSLLNSERTSEKKARFVELATKWASVAWQTPDPSSVELLSRAQIDAQELGNNAKEAECIFWRGRMNYINGDLQEALDCFKESIERGRTLGIERLQALPLSVIGRVIFWQGKIPKALQQLKEAASMLDWTHDKGEIIYNKTYQILTNAALGKFGEVKKIFGDAERMATDAAEMRSQLITLLHIRCVSDIIQGNFYSAGEFGKKAVRLAENAGVQLLKIVGGASLAYAGFFAGEPDDALSRLREAITAIEELQTQFSLSAYYGWAAEAHALRGQLRHAAKFAQKGLRMGESFGLSFIHRSLALAAAQNHRPSWGRVARVMDDCYATIERQNFRADLPIAHLRHAELLHKKGDLNEAREQLAKAAVLFGEMEMTWWPEQAEALRGRLEAGKPWKGFAPYAE